MADPVLRVMRPGEEPEVAALIHFSTNAWYVKNGRPPVFQCRPEDCLLFTDVYGDLDPGCCLVMEEAETGRIVGSCFHHPRSTHHSVGIVNVHPDCSGQGLAGRMMARVFELAGDLPVRLVSSAMNLDSFSLYTRSGFVPRQIFQDLLVRVPQAGFGTRPSPGVRPAVLSDVPQIAALERRLGGIERAGDWEYFIRNIRGIWRVFVLEKADGSLTGALASVDAAASCLVGPGAGETGEIMLALILAQLEALSGKTPVILVPVDATDVVQSLYRLGARNCELHVAQVRGLWQSPQGLVIPTFMPESG